MYLNPKNKIFVLLFLIITCLVGCHKHQIIDNKTLIYGTMDYGVSMENTGTNPHKSYYGWTAIRYGIGETLFKFNDKMELEPWIAKDFEYLDDYTVKIKIRENVCFSNGKKVTAEAIKRCFEDLIEKHERASNDLKIKSITADDNFLIIKSYEKVPALINYLSDPYGVIIDIEEEEKDGIVIGTGPYVAVKVTDREVELVKNNNYWDDIKPKLDKIIVKGISDGDMLTMAMQNGEFDIAQGIPYLTLGLFTVGTDRFKIISAETSRIYQIAFNFKNSELQDLNIRKAISKAIDKENFTKVLLNGNGSPAVGPFPKNFSYGDNFVNAVSYNLEESRELLKKSGWIDSNNDGYVDKNGKNLELDYLTYTSRQELPLLAEYTQDTLKKIGIKVNVNATDNYKSFLKSGKYDIFASSLVTAPTGDPEYYFTTSIIKGAVGNNGFYDSPKIAKLEKELHNTFDHKKRSEIAIKMTQEILDDCALIYVSHLKMSFVIKSNVKGFYAHPSDYYEITAELEKNDFISK